MTRLVDICAAALGLLILSPLFLVLALWIKLDSPGPVFYQAQRVGRYGTIFTLLKFRTMVVDADQHGPGITVSADSRITKTGHWLRRTKLDELPQLVNVLKGDMGLVGPRPEDPRYVAHYTAEQQQVLAVRPGITSAASLTFRRESDLLQGENWESVYIAEILPQKLAIERDYLAHRSIWRDLELIWQTIWVSLREPA
jgi:lipopolysaccharide/colanic/teichoic acid biosynthesis glycosyltransferase